MGFDIADTSHKHLTWVEPLARMGYGAKGVVYAVVGILAFQAAWNAGGAATGTRGAIREIAEQPFGQILLAITTVCLVGYVVWRFVQGVTDPDDKGTDVPGLVQRVGYAISGVTYAMLAWAAARIVLGAGGGSGSASKTWTARLMAQPLGQWLVGIIGAIVIGVGLYHFVRAYRARFIKHYDRSEMSSLELRWAKRLGRFGLAARGVTFVLIGVFLVQAAAHVQPDEARGLEGALETLAAQPYGPWLLGLVAAGFVAYGVYCFSRARYRRFEMQ